MDTPGAAAALVDALGAGLRISNGNPELSVLIAADDADCQPMRLATMDGMVAVNWIANWFGRRYPDFGKPERVIDMLEWCINNPDELERRTGRRISIDEQPEA